MFLYLLILPKYLIGMFEGLYSSDNNPILKLGSEWEEIIINPSTVDLYFHVICIVFIYLFFCK